MRSFRALILASCIAPSLLAQAPVPPLLADLAIVKSGGGTATLGSTVTFTITVTNGGPTIATGVEVQDPLPTGLTHVSATASQGTCSGAAPVVCALGTLTTLTPATVTVTARVEALGSITNVATVRAATGDPNTANNTASAALVASAPVPAASRWTLLALGAALGLVALLHTR